MKYTNYYRKHQANIDWYLLLIFFIDKLNRQILNLPTLLINSPI